MRVHYLQHVAFEGLGSIASWCNSAGWEVSCTKLFAGDNLPLPGGIDLLVVLGGPMSVNDEEEFPWLVAEKRFVGEVIASGKPVLGICLGAQLIANVLGARVYPNAEKEIGWFPVYGVSTQNTNVFPFPSSVEAFHWHGETFDLPAGAVQIARSEGCAHQAFQYGPSVIGLQFHLETTPESAMALVEHCRNELVEARYVQSEQRILAAESGCFLVIHRLMGDILSYLGQTAAV
ncbi:type 1 glutamine amidotransferase [Desulfopila aestuarii]|uniref:GMP synthase-Glutamine amidotransferase n=1 Tax=Desulfopila aestuarii DSM 18488 TaxID=1121416 RepID=A0A1M7YE89_9BACT|nr:type 1 glutamine amidotransferase [Desulfopila aestuarii]SHO50945.1 GMP synthase-Glutamine amidotransferase [Desulfopila aestuarii DSM 18488]